MVSKKKFVVSVAIFSVVGTLFFIGGAVFFAVGWRQTDIDENQWKIDLADKLLEDTFADDHATDDMNAVDSEEITGFIDELAKIPHMGGLQRDHELADYIKEKWLEFGLDHVEIKSYEVLLDYPNKTNPNKVEILDAAGSVLVSCKHAEVSLHPNDSHPDFVDAFLAYSAAGMASGDLVYVNYGSKQDFELLSNASSEYYTDVTGKICIARYGKIFRGNKEKNSNNFGCIGLIIFSDPDDVASPGQDANHTYPHTIFLPGSGIQRGSLALVDGDPETPNWPSLPDVYRLSKEDTDALLPQLPCQPIGYDDAKQLLSKMKGKDAPPHWIGGIRDVKYTIGGSFVTSCSGCVARITTHNHQERRMSPNVIGIIRGEIEPDRYVMLGNHRDAWGFGALDPSSGTAQLLETARVLGAKVKRGEWRPRRTIVFLSWGAEEFTLTGSREFVEDFKAKLVQRGVVYINVDVCAGGTIMEPSASPSITHKIIEATKAIPPIHESSGHSSYYDFWMDWLNGTQPDIYIPGAGSDHASFIFYTGVPVINYGFSPDSKKFPSLHNIGYPAYHTGYETLHLLKDIVDPGSKIMSTCAKMSIYMVRDFADSLLIDMDVRSYATIMAEFKKETDVLEHMISLKVDVDPLLNAIDHFINASKDFHDRVEALKPQMAKDPLLARYINDQIMKLDRVFLLSEGLPNRPMYRHAIISPSLFDAYDAGSFPGIGDLLYGIDNLQGNDWVERVELLKRHVSRLMVVILRTVDYLKAVYLL